MHRREFITLVGGAVAWPLAARAQSRSLPVVGFLNSATPETYAFNANAFREGLRRAGFVEGENVRIEYRWAKGDYSQLPALAAELIASDVKAIAATGDVASARAAKGASETVPVVFTIDVDPVRLGLVESMNGPGGHVTGVSLLSACLGAKRVQLLHELAPRVKRIGLLVNPNNPSSDYEQKDAQAGAQKLGLETVVAQARNESEIDAAFEELVRRNVDALIVGTDPIWLDRRQQIVAFAGTHKWPAIYFVQQFAAAGGLLSYGTSITWMYRRAGICVGQILMGHHPRDMPVMQPTQFELSINLKTAQTLGITVPSTLLATADCRLLQCESVVGTNAKRRGVRYTAALGE